MTKQQVRNLVCQWFAENRKQYPDLSGAYLSGSFLTASEGDPWPESSDVDVVLLFPQGKCPPKPGKFQWRGLLLEITALEETELSSLEHVLTTHYLAFALRGGELLYDPSGKWEKLAGQVAMSYGERRWVTARCESFFQRIRSGIERFPTGASLPEQVNAWAFPTGITCFPLLCAALENCTVRKRYTAARKVLERYHREDFYQPLLSQLVPRPLGRDRLTRHMDQLEETFRLACGTIGPSASYPFRSDISPDAAPSAIGGSRQLIASAHPEEAVFWMLATFSRCQIILQMDAPELAQKRQPFLENLLEDLEIFSREDFPKRLSELEKFLPFLRQTTQDLIDSKKFFRNFG